MMMTLERIQRRGLGDTKLLVKLISRGEIERRHKDLHFQKQTWEGEQGIREDLVKLQG